MYISFVILNSLVVSRLTVSPEGILQHWVWVDRTQCCTFTMLDPWVTVIHTQFMVLYGSCNTNRSPACGCLDKVEAKEPEDWTKGYVQKKPLNCHNGDSFLKYTALVLPDNRYSWFNQTMSTKESKMVCLKNCSCKFMHKKRLRWVFALVW